MRGAQRRSNPKREADWIASQVYDESQLFTKIVSVTPGSRFAPLQVAIPTIFVRSGSYAPKGGGKVPQLKETTVRRGGVTAHYWYETIRSVAVNAASELRISFSMSSKGGGYTQVQVEIRPEDFATIVEMMSLVNRQAAMEAMSTELARQVRTQSERDAKAIEEAKKGARQAIQQLAFHKFISKPNGEDEQERIVSAGVKEIISEIEGSRT